MRIVKKYVIAAGTPVNLATGLATAASAADQLLCTKVFVQMRTGGSGQGYLIDGVAWGRVPATDTQPDYAVQLSAATAQNPGGAYADQDFREGGGIDVSKMWLDGAHTGDEVLVSLDLKV